MKLVPGLRLIVVVPFYKPAYIYGGPVRSVSALCEGLTRLGCAVTVLTTNANGDDALDVDTSVACTVDGVKVCYYPRKKGLFLFYSPALQRACAEQVRAFDLVYIASSWVYPQIPATRAAAQAGIPYIISPRTAFMRATWRGKFLKKAIYHLLVERVAIQGAAAIHYTSQLEREKSRWLRLQSKPVVVPNPVNISDFAALPQRGSFRETYGIAADEKVILCLCRIEPRKGLDLAIRAFGKIVSSCHPVRFVIAGPGGGRLMRELKALAGSLGLADRVVFTGMLGHDERLAAYRDADLFVLASRGENFAMSVVEAMASDLPVVVTDAVGVASDLAAHGAGLVVPQEEPALAEALGKLLKSEGMRKTMGEAGKLHARIAYDPDTVSRLWLDRFAPAP